MKTPYEILNIAVDASDADIKQAYLHKVKDNPPDRDQEQFQVIHNAYTAIKDHQSRLRYELFTLPVADFGQFIDQALQSEQPCVLSPEHTDQLLRTSIDEASLLNVFAKTGK